MAEKGKSMTQAREEFLELAKPLLDEKHIDYSDPKKDMITREY